MPVIAIVGAGPGLGLEIARVFGRRGFSVARVARTQVKLDDLPATLEAEASVIAQGYWKLYEAREVAEQHYVTLPDA